MFNTLLTNLSDARRALTKNFKGEEQTQTEVQQDSGSTLSWSKAQVKQFLENQNLIFVDAAITDANSKSINNEQNHSVSEAIFLIDWLLKTWEEKINSINQLQKKAENPQKRAMNSEKEAKSSLNKKDKKAKRKQAKEYQKQADKFIEEASQKIEKEIYPLLAHLIADLYLSYLFKETKKPWFVKWSHRGIELGNNIFFNGVKGMLHKSDQNSEDLRLSISILRYLVNEGQRSQQNNPDIQKIVQEFVMMFRKIARDLHEKTEEKITEENVGFILRVAVTLIKRFSKKFGPAIILFLPKLGLWLLTPLINLLLYLGGNLPVEWGVEKLKQVKEKIKEKTENKDEPNESAKKKKIHYQMKREKKGKEEKS